MERSSGPISNNVNYITTNIFLELLNGKLSIILQTKVNYYFETYKKFLEFHDASRVATSDSYFEDISEETKKAASCNRNCTEEHKCINLMKRETYDIP